MATIGSLSVNIVAKTDKLLSGLKKAQGALGKFTSGIGALNAAVSGLSIYGLAKMATDVIQAGDAIYDLSQKLSIGTAQLGALQYASEQLGSSTEAMNKGLQFLNKNIGLMQQGSQKATDDFARLGLSAQDLVNLTLDQKFLKVAEAIKGLATDTEQAAAAQQIFGKGGAELLPIIRAGTDAIKAQAEAAAKSGSLYTDEQAERMNNAADAIKNMAASWQGLKIALTEGFAEPVLQVIDFISALLQKFMDARDALEQFNLVAMRFMGDTGAGIEGQLRDLEKRRAARGAGSGGGPLAAPTNRGPVPVAIVKDTTQQSGGDTIQLGTAGIR